MIIKMLFVSVAIYFLIICLTIMFLFLEMTSERNNTPTICDVGDCEILADTGKKVCSEKDLIQRGKDRLCTKPFGCPDGYYPIRHDLSSTIYEADYDVTKSCDPNVNCPCSDIQRIARMFSSYFSTSDDTYRITNNWTLPQQKSGQETVFTYPPLMINNFGDDRASVDALVGVTYAWPLVCSKGVSALFVPKKSTTDTITSIKQFHEQLKSMKQIYGACCIDMELKYHDSNTFGPPNDDKHGYIRSYIMQPESKQGGLIAYKEDYAEGKSQRTLMAIDLSNSSDSQTLKDRAAYINDNKIQIQLRDFILFFDLLNTSTTS